MAKKKKVEAVEEIVDVKQEEVVEETPQAEEPKVKNEVLEDGTIKVDLRQNENVDKEANDDVVKVEIPSTTAEEPTEEITEEPVAEEPVEDMIALEEVTEEEVVEKLEEDIEEAIEKAEEEGTKLPENIQKVVDFMDETGGTLEDYVELNKDYSKMSDNDLLNEYFKQTKPHLTDEERSFVMEDLYSYDEELDEERDIKRKKLALKEQVANAKNHLDGLKSKYYDEIKAGSRLNPEQQKAMDFFNRYNKNQTVAEDNAKFFKRKTNEVFSDGFKGFEYSIGDKRFRLNVKDTDSVKENQMDIGNFVNKFLNKETSKIEDAKGYHKSLFTAMNPDVVANHFYQQGKADALKESMSKAKNVDMSPRGTLANENIPGGMKVRAVPSGESSSDFKIKIGQNRSTNRIT
jgi:hypothetical protein